MSGAYYNENDPKAAEWLRELIKAGHIAPGYVDERSITEVQPSDLSPYAQCHFFGGVGGWSLALRMAGVADSDPIWTGSCPCQPFSAAGKQLGDKDERHLWPAFFQLIAQCRPELVFGEQVANAIGKGWLDGISADLDSEGYACGAAVLGAHSVGAPHIRQRLYWMAYRPRERRDRRSDLPESAGRTFAENGGAAGGMGDTVHSIGREIGRPLENEHNRTNAGRPEALGYVGTPSPFWDSFDLLPCTDGKARRVESGTFPLAHGIPGRVGLLRGYGNAIVPQVAAEFIQAAIEALSPTNQ